ncbi:MAG TPA: SAM-dependent methyltransferase [Terrimicrobiaceae bacterium]
MSDAAKKLNFLLELQETLGGCIPFERWMREALYHSEFGYYTANIREFGRRGDFTTWPVMNKSLGRAIARWALENRPSGRWNLIEIGAGSGELAASIMKTIGWWNRPRYHIVEISPRLRKLQQERLGSSARWHASLPEALAATGGTALIFSNELVDAFPCRVFRKDPSGWRELALRLEAGRAVEEWATHPLPDSTVFSHSWPDGQRVEVHESFRVWMRGWLPAWRAGSVLTIDYGNTCPNLYFRRPHGTLRAYAHHQRLEGRDVYAGFGLRDLTADVNFSDLMSDSTFSAPAFNTLAEFVARHDPSAVEDRSAEILYSSGGASEAFKALVQTR